MFGLGLHTKVYIARDPVDMRRQIDGLSLHVQEVLALDPLSSHVFVFRNRAGNKLKLLYWHYSGFCLLYKRLEKQRFHWPRGDAPVVVYSLRELVWLLEGLNIASLQPHHTLHFTRV